MEIERKFGESVRHWRDKLRLSQEELAKRAGLHRTYVCDVERGARNVSLKNVQKLATGLAIPLSSLLASLDAPAVTSLSRNDEMVDILLVDDTAEDVTLMKHVLEGWNISNRLYAVNDGVAALNFLFGTGAFTHRKPSDQPRIILLDVNLPKIDGVEVLRRIKADPRTRSIPVVMLTGSIHERDIAECKRLGAADYITKPLNLQNFSQVSLKLNLQWALLHPAASSS